jgi:hypothetical protein
MCCVCYGSKIERKNRAAKYIVMFYNYFTFRLATIYIKKRPFNNVDCRMVFLLKCCYMANPFFPE